MKRNKTVTMKDIAAEAGISRAAVSLALKGSSSVSDATRTKVEKIARKLGYRRNPYVSALIHSRRKGKLPASSPLLAFVTMFPSFDSWRSHSPLFPLYYDGAQNRALERGFRMEHFWLGENGVHAHRGSQILFTRNVAGILLAPLPPGVSTVDFAWKHFPVVALGFSLASPDLHRVSCDHFHSLLLAREACYNRGYRRIGIALTASANDRVGNRWLAASELDTSHPPGVKTIPPLLMDYWGDPKLHDWLREHRPDAVITTTGENMLAELEKAGLQVPADIGLVTLSARTRQSPIAGIFQNPTLLAARAVDLLIDSLARNEHAPPDSPNTLLIDGLWCSGATLPRRREPAGSSSTFFRG